MLLYVQFIRNYYNLYNLYYLYHTTNIRDKDGGGRPNVVKTVESTQVASKGVKLIHY